MKEGRSVGVKECGGEGVWGWKKGGVVTFA